MAAERSLRAAATAVRAKGRRACERSSGRFGDREEREKLFERAADHGEKIAPLLTQLPPALPSA